MGMSGELEVRRCSVGCAFGETRCAASHHKTVTATSREVNPAIISVRSFAAGENASFWSELEILADEICSSTEAGLAVFTFPELLSLFSRCKSARNSEACW